MDSTEGERVLAHTVNSPMLQIIIAMSSSLRLRIKAAMSFPRPEGKEFQWL